MYKVENEIIEVINCNTERAFKTPILGDATKFLNGYFLQPPVIGFKDDATWGQVNGVRYPVIKGNWLVPEGVIFTDKILQRIDNKFWQWIIYDFQLKLMFYTTHAIGEWEIMRVTGSGITVRYSYAFYSTNIFYHLLTKLFVAVQYRGMMEKAIKGIKQQAESNAPFVYQPLV